MNNMAQSPTGWSLPEAEGNGISSFVPSHRSGLDHPAGDVTCRHVLTGFLLFALLPASVFAAQVQSHSHEIESLELRYLATKNPEQRKRLVSELKSLTKNNSKESAALSEALTAMLPAADSVAEAEALLEIAAAHPTVPPAGQVQGAEDAEFLVDARQTAQAARHASGDVEALADIRIDHLHTDNSGRDGLTSAHLQRIWRVNTMQGARSFSPRAVMYSGMSETLSMVRSRVLKSDGRESDAAVSADQPVVERGSSMYFDSRSRDLRFKKLEPGDVVEIEYYLLPTAAVNPWAGYYARLDMLRASLPTRLWRRVVIAPNTMKLYAVEHGLHPPAVLQKGVETMRIWEAREIGVEPFGALSPGASRPYLHVSTIGSMEELGRWYSGLLEPGLKLDENLRTVAQHILERHLVTRDRVQAVYESVQRSTKFVGFEFGVHNYQPYAVSMVQERGFGDCKDKAAMIVALLRAVGVDAEFAMVRTRSAGAMAAGAYSVQLFNHAMAFVPKLNLYLDGTAKTSLGELPPDDQGATAMTLDAHGNATRRTVPSQEANLVAREVPTQLDNSQVEKFSGYFAGEQVGIGGSTKIHVITLQPSASLADGVGNSE